MRVRGRGTLPEAYDELHLGIVLYHPETADVVDANDRATALYGYTAAQLRELSVDVYSANTYSFFEQTLRSRVMAAAGGHPQRFKWRVKRADGALIWVRVDMSRVTFDDRPYVLAEVRDITEQHDNHRQVSLLSRIIRHNLRNDVNVITGYAEKIEAESVSDRLSQYARKIQNQAADIASIPESVKQIERAIDTSDTDRSLRNVRTVVAAVVEKYRTAYPDADITITERTGMWVHVDDALAHALEHAIENAIVHNDRPNPTVGVIVGESPNTGRVEIRIVDDGPTIPPVEVEALDGRAQTTSTSHGSGVGLFVMKWCIESLGGELKIESREDRGNVVHFYLPPKTPVADS